MSPKQTKVINWLKDHESINITEAVDVIGADVYANKRFHCGNLLRNMVKRGMLVGNGKGTYRRPVTATTALPLPPVFPPS